MEQDNKQGQSRFLIAAVLSMVVLFAWSYFFTPRAPEGDANTNTATAEQAAAPAPSETPAPPAEQPAAEVQDNVPQREVVIRSPLYEVKLNSKGAVATSWILLRNKTNG